MNTKTPAAGRPESLYDYDEDLWRNRFPAEPYVAEGETFDDYEPAYRYGTRLRAEYHEFEPHEDAIRERWQHERGRSRLEWSRAREPVKIAWFQERRFAEAEPAELFNP